MWRAICFDAVCALAQADSGETSVPDKPGLRVVGHIRAVVFGLGLLDMAMTFSHASTSATSR